MLDPTITCFKQEFDRFLGFIEEQIVMCPEAAWTERVGDTPFWLHLLHTLGCIEYYARPHGAPLKQTAFPRDVVRLRALPEGIMNKAEMTVLVADMRAVAHAYFETQSTQTLADKNLTMSEHMGKDCTNVQALIALIRHNAYHIGCCDSVLRMHGLPGVY